MGTKQHKIKWNSDFYFFDFIMLKNVFFSAVFFVAVKNVSTGILICNQDVDKIYLDILNFNTFWYLKILSCNHSI